METLQQEFLGDAIIQLDKLILQLNESSDGPTLSEVFRRIHTIKGTSQVFALKAPADLAHNIENLLQNLGGSSKDPNLIAILIEGLENLSRILTNIKHGEKAYVSTDYVNKLQSLLATQPPDEGALKFPKIPASLLGELTQTEKDSIYAELGIGHQLFLIDLFLSPDSLYQLKTFREFLAKQGKIIATSAAENSFGDQLGFRIYFVGDIDISSLEESLKGFKTQIIYPQAQIEVSNSPDINGALAQIVSSGERAAEMRGKRISFEIGAPSYEINGESLKAIYEILLHLVRNAIDHGIELPNERIALGKKADGTIKIAFPDNALLFEDDGRGIDLDGIREKAILTNLIGKNDEPDRLQLLDLIFAHGLTTCGEVSDYSGRGIGLDIVRQTVEKEGGSIKVSTETGKGTSFHIKLPNPAAA